MRIMARPKKDAAGDLVAHESIQAAMDRLVGHMRYSRLVAYNGRKYGRKTIQAALIGFADTLDSLPKLEAILDAGSKRIIEEGKRYMAAKSQGASEFIIPAVIKPPDFPSADEIERQWDEEWDRMTEEERERFREEEAANQEGRTRQSRGRTPRNEKPKRGRPKKKPD